MLIEFSHRFAESAGISDYFTCVSIVLSLEIYIFFVSHSRSIVSFWIFERCFKIKCKQISITVLG